MKIIFKNNKEAKKKPKPQKQQNVFTPKRTIINSHVKKPKFQHEHTHTHTRKKTHDTHSVCFVCYKCHVACYPVTYNPSTNQN